MKCKIGQMVILVWGTVTALLMMFSARDNTAHAQGANDYCHTGALCWSSGMGSNDGYCGANSASNDGCSCYVVGGSAFSSNCGS